MTSTSGASVSRRSIAKGVAWAVPAITAASIVPAFAASPPFTTLTSAICQVVRMSGDTANQVNMYIIPGVFGSPSAPIPAGSTFTFSFTIDETYKSSTETTPVPSAPSNPNYGGWSFGTLNRTSVTGSYTTRVTFTATFTFSQTMTMGDKGFFCLPQLDFSSANYKPSTGASPTGFPTTYANTIFTITGGTGATVTSFSFNVGAFLFSGTSAKRPLSIVSLSGYSTWTPNIQFQGGSLQQTSQWATYCTSDTKSSWASTCYTDCYANINYTSAAGINYCGTDWKCMQGFCGPNYTNAPGYNVATNTGCKTGSQCVSKDCSGTNCCISTGCSAG